MNEMRAGAEHTSDVRTLRRTVGLRLLELARTIGPALSALRVATTAESEETCDAAGVACDRVSLELRKCLSAVENLGRALPRSSRPSAPRTSNVA